MKQHGFIFPRDSSNPKKGGTMPIRHLFWATAFTALLSATLAAQQTPSFYTVACVKIKPGKTAALNALVSGELNKYEQSRVDSGTVSAAIETRAVSPSGAQAMCDREFIEFYSGVPDAPMSEAETTSALQKAGISSSAEELSQQEDAVGYLVSFSIVRQALRVGTAKKGDYVVVNDMKVANTEAWIANEKKLWQPIFEDGVKDGSMDGWGVDVSFMPRGAEDPYITYTVDIYPSWQALYSFFGPSFPERWKKVNPDIPIAEGMKQERTMDTIEHTTLSEIVSMTQPRK